MKKALLHIFSSIVWIIVSIYAIVVILLHIPAVQVSCGQYLSNILENKIGAKVEISRIDLGFLNRVIADGFIVYDQNGKQMIRLSRLSIKIDPIELIYGKVNISSAQMFGLDAKFYKDSEDSNNNFQSVLDSLSSKDTTKQTQLDLRIASLVIRNGSISYDKNYIPRKHDSFDPNHIAISKISSHIMLYELTDETIDLNFKHLSLSEKSDIDIKHLGFLLKKERGVINLNELELALPHSYLAIPEAQIKYDSSKDIIDLRSASYYGNVDIKELSPKDLSRILGKDLTGIPTLSGHFTSKGSNGNLKCTARISTSDKNLGISFGADIQNMTKNPNIRINDFTIHAEEEFIRHIATSFDFPSQVTLLGDIDANIKINGTIKNCNSDMNVTASKIGNLSLKALYDDGNIDANFKTTGLNLQPFTTGNIFGNISASLNVKANINDIDHIRDLHVTGDVEKFEMMEYNYKDISFDAHYDNECIDGVCSINDPNIIASINGSGNIFSSSKKLDATINVENFNPHRLNISNNWGDAFFDMHINTNLTGNNIDDIIGYIHITDFAQHGGKNKDLEFNDTYRINNFHLTVEKDQTNSIINLNSDILDAEVKGVFALSTLPNSLTALVESKLCTIPGLHSASITKNNFKINAELKEAKWMRRLLGLDFDLQAPIALQGFVNDLNKQANLYLNIPTATINGFNIKDGKFLLWTPDKSLRSNMSFVLQDDDNNWTTIKVDANALEDIIHSTITWDSKGKDRFQGNLKTNTKIYSAIDGSLAMNIGISPSDIQIGDSIWHLHSRDIAYSNNNLNIDHFALENSNQHIFINGKASKNQNDSIIADLKNVDVGYILNLVNFHSVEFDGFATGQVIAKRLFSTPEAYAHLDVKDFLFQEGHMGDFHINAKLNNTLKQIDIDAFADDSYGKALAVKGEVSPQKNELDLHIDAVNTNLDFLHSFCSSFLQDIDARGAGNVRLYGPFSNINITGNIMANGTVMVTPLNCKYALHNAAIKFIPDDIQVDKMPLYDEYGNIAYMSGGLHHKSLTRMTYDFNIEAKNFLCYNFKDFGESTFYGTAFLTGECNIKGRSSELTIDVKGDVEKGSRIVYNASSPDAITKQEFITWHSMTNNNTTLKAESLNRAEAESKSLEEDDVRTNIRMNLLFNVTPESSLYLLMDPATGDYIDLHGSGVLRANYYNKGGLDLFGNYLIDNGTYRMTIQNVIRREFEFQKGGTITFGGDPYNASLNLQALYVVNSVPISDLNIGNSFSSNNIRVNCLMNITGTPGIPSVDFSMDMPTVNAEAKQMIYSVINGEEEMNQQVLYLLSVGRFYSQTGNNAGLIDNQSSSTTSLAMQSLLSGTLSQQINNVLSSVINNQNWNFGANISPGDEGFTNAEYEGLLNGSLFNNRLQFNGQFGYRDNATTAQQGFIGDFDIKYNLLPTGNLAVRVYNQTNDRYFTKNSLNTQGLGLIIKKDFNSWRDFFTWRRKRNKK